MENRKIIFKENVKKQDYFSLILCIITLLILVFQVMANRHISKASHDFIEGERAKRMAVQIKERKALHEKELEAQRLKQQREEEEFRASMEEKNRGKEVDKIAEIQNGMDYRQKLEIARRSQANAAGKAGVNYKAAKTGRPVKK